jgi:DNA-directed RNA polymerase alpha subunit
MEWRAKVEAMQAKVDAAEQKSKKANSHLKTKIVTKVKVIHDKQIIIKKEIVEKAAAIDAECKVSSDAINILNAAAKTPIEVKTGDAK